METESIDVLHLKSEPTNPPKAVAAERARTSLRLQYQAQVAVIQKQAGDLEEIRARLGLSARKMCQLLLVDPSSWSRWVNKGDDCPPHIWRALQWYLTLQEKYPHLDSHYYLGKDVQHLGHQLNEKLSRFQRQIDNQQTELFQNSNRQLQEVLFQLDVAQKKESKALQEIQKLKRMFLLLSLGFAVSLGLILYAFNLVH